MPGLGFVLILFFLCVSLYLFFCLLYCFSLTKDSQEYTQNDNSEELFLTIASLWIFSFSLLKKKNQDFSPDVFQTTAKGHSTHDERIHSTVLHMNTNGIIYAMKEPSTLQSIVYR